MAYNLESLVQILDQILHPHHHHPLWLLDPNKGPQIVTLLEKARFLKDLFSESSCSAVSTGYGKQSLECRIRDAAYDAEDVLESHLSENSFKSERWELHFLPSGFGKNRRQFITSCLIIKARSKSEEHHCGVGEDLIQLKDRLTGQPSNALQVIPIVGMGGIGKTTLAQNLYDDPSVISHFDTRAWVTISQDYNKQNLQHVLLSLLSCVIGKPKDEMLGMSNDQLALCLHQALKGRRYLIILDDMWDVKPWDDTSRFFPDENNGSQIIVTTRESSVADYTGSGSSHHQMNLLKDDESWNLLHQKVFAPEDTCSPELEKVGKKIAKDCRGLPLSIHVIGGILSQAKTSQDFWSKFRIT
ncbi:UNVERIFIED_CONTAM: putative late blight resistance proteinR1A-4 [Sesamum angustifolium]|uniref:Late blight resistance proteinR1A-4 n=1 Tax=Sesamum angustifolium TaxID=2727405 RepID=A0AAW2QAB1_9LAMI